MYGRENVTSDILILLYALLIFIQKKTKVRKVRQEDQPKYKIYNEYVVDKGAILSSLTYVMAFLVEQMSSILPVCFAIFATGLRGFAKVFEALAKWTSGSLNSLVHQKIHSSTKVKL